MNAAAITEHDFQRGVIDLAHVLGWRVAHFRPALTRSSGWRTPVAADGAGFPDLVLVRGDRLVVAELKSATGSGPDQQAWLDAFAAAGIDAYVWRPADLQSVAAVLR